MTKHTDGLAKRKAASDAVKIQWVSDPPTFGKMPDPKLVRALARRPGHWAIVHEGDDVKAEANRWRVAGAKILGKGVFSVRVRDGKAYARVKPKSERRK